MDKLVKGIFALVFLVFLANQVWELKNRVDSWYSWREYRRDIEKFNNRKKPVEPEPAAEKEKVRI